MKVLTKELKNDLDLHDIYCVLTSQQKRTLPVIFLNGRPDGVADSDVKTVKTNLNLSDKENELSFMLLPANFMFCNEYNLSSPQAETRSPENDFFDQYINRLRIISYLPEKILKQVKDKRLLAMGYAEQKVKEAIIKYIKSKTIVALQVLKTSVRNSLLVAYDLTIEKQFEKLFCPKVYSLENLFENAIITNVQKVKKDVYIHLKHKNAFVLKEAITLEEEINPENAFIEKFELYKNKRNYELHLLLMTKDDNLVERFHYVTYAFKDMCLK